MRLIFACVELGACDSAPPPGLVWRTVVHAMTATVMTTLTCAGGCPFAGKGAAAGGVCPASGARAAGGGGDWFDAPIGSPEFSQGLVEACRLLFRVADFGEASVWRPLVRCSVCGAEGRARGGVPAAVPRGGLWRGVRVAAAGEAFGVATLVEKGGGRGWQGAWAASVRWPLVRR